jgi:hypothetical protein
MKNVHYSGLKLQGPRPSQEDEFRFNTDKNIFSVADGFGGALPGASASSRSCELIENFLMRSTQDVDATLPFVLRSYISLAGNVLFNALIYANQKILEDNRKSNMNQRGGASVLAGFMDGDLLSLANVGSCEAWLLREQKVASLVSPRVYGRLVDPTGVDIARSRDCASGVPLGALGIYEDLEPEIIECRIRRGDWLVLQTSGMSIGKSALLVEEMSKIKQKQLTCDRASEEVFNFLRGSSLIVNNFSVLLVMF